LIYTYYIQKNKKIKRKKKRDTKDGKKSTG
jgi:hypothetical protein